MTAYLQMSEKHRHFTYFDEMVLIRFLPLDSRRNEQTCSPLILC